MANYIEVKLDEAVKPYAAGFRSSDPTKVAKLVDTFIDKDKGVVIYKMEEVAVQQPVKASTAAPNAAAKPNQKPPVKKPVAKKTVKK